MMTAKIIEFRLMIYQYEHSVIKVYKQINNIMQKFMRTSVEDYPCLAIIHDN